VILLRNKPDKKNKVRGFGSGEGVANHPRHGGATRLGAEVGSAATAGVIHGTPRRYQTMKKK
jgi:hypothetical protein